MYNFFVTKFKCLSFQWNKNKLVNEVNELKMWSHKWMKKKVTKIFL